MMETVARSGAGHLRLPYLDDSTSLVAEEPMPMGSSGSKGLQPRCWSASPAIFHLDPRAFVAIHDQLDERACLQREEFITQGRISVDVLWPEYVIADFDNAHRQPPTAPFGPMMP